MTSRIPSMAMRSLAELTEPLRDAMLQMAMKYNTNIVTGSLPIYQEERLYNVAFLCRRDGTWGSQYKLHITPDEAEWWGFRGGNELKVFDTDIGKIGILICFDVTGSVGNLPKVKNMDIQYSQSAIFTPSDFSFPHDAVAAEATPNTEMTLLADLDLDLLKEIRKHGSVRNLESRRADLYSVRWVRGSGR
jgi:predicted amidohydrolase